MRAYHWAHPVSAAATGGGACATGCTCKHRHSPPYPAPFNQLPSTAATLTHHHCRYYAKIAVTCNRTYYSLITISLITAASRCARDQLRKWEPRSAGLKWVDPIQVCMGLETLMCK